MAEFTDRYYPTICVRRAEMRAMAKLPLEEKQKMLPIVLLAPWLNSISFDNTIAVIKKCIGDIPIIVDIDRYFRSDSDLPSRQFWRELLDDDTGHVVWMDFVEKNPNYIPTVQTLGKTLEQIHYQVARCIAMDRGMVFRFEIERRYEYPSVFGTISSNIDNNILCVFDAGYGDPTELTEKSVSDLINRLVAISPEARFVVSASSFPNDFSDFDDFSASKQIGSRILFGNLSGNYGNYNMFYGDWGSTKPRRYDGGGSRPLPRIDYPTKGRWIIARSKGEEWDFEEASKRITRLPEWDDRPIVWGTGMIEKTAKGLPGGISTGPEAIAARVNIHLFLQNNFSSTEPPPPPQGKWIDPI
jgi:Beta protein